MSEPNSNVTFFDLGLGHLEQYFGIWAIDSDFFQKVIASVNASDLLAHIAAHRSDVLAADSYMVRQGDIAVINIEGTLTKYGTSASSGSSTVRLRQDMRNAMRDDGVAAIMLRIDSPGGTVAGIHELGQDIVRARERKPVISYIEDIGASAAYWIAAQGSEVYASPMAIIGSIGVYSFIEDMSRAMANAGIKIHVIKSAPFKGATVPGVAITDETLAQLQSRVDTFHSFFADAIASGRKMSPEKVAAIADGRVWIGKDAQAAGLIDGIDSFEGAMDKLMQQSMRKKKMPIKGMPMKPMMETQRRTVMAEANDNALEPAVTAPTAATLAELKSNLVGADSDFIVAQLEAAATLTSAQKAWSVEQSKRSELLKAELEKTKAEAAKPKQETHGVDAIAPSASADGSAWADPIADWNSAVAKACAQFPNNKRRAITEADKANPGLREAMIEAYNQRGAR